MSEVIHHYDIGQWVVHCRYGVGQIKKIESIPLHGDTQTKELCFQVQTRDGIFWFPVEPQENPRVRPVVTKRKLVTSLETLKEPPEDTDAHHNELRIRINNAQTDVSMKTTIRLIRDLSARNAIKKLNILEERTLRRHTNRLVREWALCMDVDETKAQTEFDMLLRE